MSKYWLFSKASRSFRASTLPERSTTAVGTCLTSVMIAQPEMRSMATGTNSMSVSARRSRPSWRNSFAMMPWSRLPTSAPGGPERPELLAHARLALAIDERHEEVLHVRLDLVGPLHADRSEEHTSELQSRVDLVCRLLLEKKKKYTTNRSAPSPTSPRDRAGTRSPRR